MSIIVCGLKREGDEYVCPYCGFHSTDFEAFATSMCWTCVYQPEDADLEPPDIEDDYEEEAALASAADDPPPWWA